MDCKREKSRKVIDKNIEEKDLWYEFEKQCVCVCMCVCICEYIYIYIYIYIYNIHTQIQKEIYRIKF